MQRASGDETISSLQYFLERLTYSESVLNSAVNDAKLHKISKKRFSWCWGPLQVSDGP